MTLEGFIRPGNSIKEFVFPRHEKLYEYKLEGKEIELADIEPPTQRQVIFGSRPCDSAALSILDAVMSWDYDDIFYQKRRENTTIVSVVCGEFDSHCFCTSCGLSNDSDRGSDAMLLDRGDGSYEVHILTDKGKTLFEGKTEQIDAEPVDVPAGPPAEIDLAAIDAFLEGDFEDPRWNEMALRCVGCGGCAYTCPTCHCFDIVDERRGNKGARVRNWDACQHCMFTMHASGHNPRENQGQRQRQRVMHKFNIYKDKFGELLCTGCGNCSRTCSVGLGVKPVLRMIVQLTSEQTQE